jgi:hypothetical protein
MMTKQEPRNFAILRGITGVTQDTIDSATAIQIMINPIRVKRGIWLHILLGLLIGLLRTKPTYGAI